jgi:hypothetical protein
MKLATLNDGTRDGQLMVVSRDLKTAQLADGVCRTLQRALDDWTFIAPQLDAIYQELNRGGGRRSFDFEPATAWRRCAPSSGRTVRPTSTTSSWCARRAAPRCPPRSGKTR